MMKKILFLALLVSLLEIQGIFAQNQEKQPILSASTRQFLFELEKGKFKEHGMPTQYVYNRVNAGPVLVNAFIKVSEDFQEAQLKAAGVLVGTRPGVNRAVRIPIGKLAEVCRIPGVLAIDMEQPGPASVDSGRNREGGGFG